MCVASAVAAMPLTVIAENVALLMANVCWLYGCMKDITDRCASLLHASANNQSAKGRVAAWWQTNKKEAQ
jgi:hypothetical protein